MEEGQRLSVERLGAPATTSSSGRSWWSTATPSWPPRPALGRLGDRSGHLGEAKGPKINAFTCKNKAKAEARGHRQSYHTIEITGITAG